MPQDLTHGPGPVTRIYVRQRGRAHSGDSAIFLPRLIVQSDSTGLVEMDNAYRRPAEEERFGFAIVSHDE